MAEQAAVFNPKLLIAGGSAYPRDWDYARYREIANQNGAMLMMDMAHISGIVAAKECNNPFEYCDIVSETPSHSAHFSCTRSALSGAGWLRAGLDHHTQVAARCVASCHHRHRCCSAQCVCVCVCVCLQDHAVG